MVRSARLRCRLRCSRNRYRCRLAWRLSTHWRTMALNIINPQCRSGIAESSRKKVGQDSCPATISTIDGHVGMGFAVAPMRPCPTSNGSCCHRSPKAFFSTGDAIFGKGYVSIDATFSYGLTYTLFFFFIDFGAFFTRSNDFTTIRIGFPWISNVT